VGEGINLKGVHSREHSMKTSAREILHLSRVELQMGTFILPQVEMCWSRLAWLLLIC
jgi:hypothetical protein